MILSDFFYINKGDRRVILTFLLLGVLAFVAVCLLDNDVPVEEDEQTAEWKRDDRSKKKENLYYQVEERQVERFPFDPNTADSTQFLRLGLQPWQVRNIYKYRASGGIYRTKEDFARLYGLTVKQYRELEPYIQISSDYLPASTLVADHDTYERDTLLHPRKVHEGETVCLNNLDTATLQRVPGIGSYYARRIVAYGERLGGYVSVDQLDEIDDVPAEAKKYMQVTDGGHVRKLHINKLSVNELKRHPYINYYQARAIVDYRRLHGPITDLQQLSLLQDFPSEAIARLRPYVSYQ